MVNSSPLTLYVHVIALSERVSNFAIRHEPEIAFDLVVPIADTRLLHNRLWVQRFRKNEKNKFGVVEEISDG
jgi:hypothetical protein